MRIIGVAGHLGVGAGAALALALVLGRRCGGVGVDDPVDLVAVDGAGRAIKIIGIGHGIFRPGGFSARERWGRRWGGRCGGRGDVAVEDAVDLAAVDGAGRAVEGFGVEVVQVERGIVRTAGDAGNVLAAGDAGDVLAAWGAEAEVILAAWGAEAGVRGA